MVESKIDETLQISQKMYGDSKEWDAAFDAIKAITKSSQRHLLRPQLVMLGYATGKNGDLSAVSQEDVIRFAAGTELHHLFMLIMDDNMDNGTIRRGVPTVNRVLQQLGTESNPFASMGDTVHLTTIIANILLILSNDLMRLPDTSDEVKQLRSWNNAARIIDGATLSAGSAQFADIVGWKALQSDSKAGSRIRALLMDKSGNHTFRAPLLAGLELAGSKDWCLMETARMWSESIGIAFQSLDDVLDVMGDPLDSGKDSMQDILEGRISLPLFLLRSQATDEEWEFVRSLQNGGKFPIVESDRIKMFKLCDKYQLVKQTLDFVETEINNSSGVVEGCLLDSVQECAASHDFLSDGLGSIAEGLRDRLEQVRSVCSTTE